MIPEYDSESEEGNTPMGEAYEPCKDEIESLSNLGIRTRSRRKKKEEKMIPEYGLKAVVKMEYPTSKSPSDDGLDLKRIVAEISKDAKMLWAKMKNLKEHAKRKDVKKALKGVRTHAKKAWKEIEKLEDIIWRY